MDLTKYSGKDTAGNRSPVWRLITVNPATNPGAVDPDDPANPATVDRAVYFLNPTTTLSDGTTVTLPPGGPLGGTVQFYPDGTFCNLIAPVLPGRYTLIGPGDPNPTAPGSSTTYLGFNAGENPGNVPVNPNNPPRRIVLAPSTNPNASQVAVYNNGGTIEDATAVPLTIQPRAAVVVNQPLRLICARSRILDIPRTTSTTFPMRHGRLYDCLRYAPGRSRHQPDADGHIQQRADR